MEYLSDGAAERRKDEITVFSERVEDACRTGSAGESASHSGESTAGRVRVLVSDIDIRLPRILRYRICISRRLRAVHSKGTES